MKEPLKLPFVFLFILLCVTVVLSALALFSAWGRGPGPGTRLGRRVALGHFAAAAFEVLIPAVVVSIVLLGFRMARRPFSRLGGFLITLCVGYIVLVNGMILLSSLSGKAGPAESEARGSLQPRHSRASAPRFCPLRPCQVTGFAACSSTMQLPRRSISPCTRRAACPRGKAASR